MINLSQADYKKLFPKARKGVLEAINTALAIYEINETKDRLCFFLAQLAHESNGLTVKEENLNYSAKRLTQVWPSRFPSIEAAKPYANNPKALAEKTYGGRMGNNQKGDGFKYRGRGAIQITGKSNYAAISKICGHDFVENPDLVSSPEYYIDAACAFWKLNNLNRYADKGNFVSLTKVINGGTIGLADRRAWLAKIRAVVDKYDGIETHGESLSKSRTISGAGSAAIGGAAIVAQSAQDTATQLEQAQSHITAGNIFGLVIGALILAGALYAVYAKWDDAGRPKLWGAS
jgi:putative chitinase